MSPNKGIFIEVTISAVNEEKQSLYDIIHLIVWKTYQRAVVNPTSELPVSRH